jgi:hypothetical protein
MLGERTTAQTLKKPLLTTLANRSLQRACGQHSAESVGECEECHKKRLDTLQRSAVNNSTTHEVPPIVHEVLRSPGLPIDTSTRAFMEPRFRQDFSHVRLHTDAKAAASARAVNALAYTVGQDVVFNTGQYAPATVSGNQLLAHELTHVTQQPNTGRFQKRAGISIQPLFSSFQGYEFQADDAAWRIGQGEQVEGAPLVTGVNVLQKAEKLGTRVTQPKGAKRPYKKITATFDGKDFVMQGDGIELIRAEGESGRPYTVSEADAKACGGSPDDSYLNNARYVGSADNGPIPEGEFTFLRTDMLTFTRWEQAKMALARESEYVDPSGLALHGDWGAARAPLRPIRVRPTKLCGSTTGRSGFYLHGGVMPGSSGCIDIGNDAIMGVVEVLAGYPDPVHVFVKYTQPPPDVSSIKRAAGRFMYPPGKNPSLIDRFKSLYGW